MPRVDSSKAVTVLGIGRADYSQNVEQSVEPLIRGWQRDYQVYKTFTIVASNDQLEEITIDGSYIVIPYDFYCSCVPAVDLDLRIDMYTAAGSWAPIAYKSANQFVDIRIAKGHPFARKWRIRVKNLDLILDSDFYFSAHGIYTDETTYYGGVPTEEETV